MAHSVFRLHCLDSLPHEDGAELTRFEIGRIRIGSAGKGTILLAGIGFFTDPAYAILRCNNQ
jgi:hypothetical protein